MPSPAQADIRCSTVRTRTSPTFSVEARRVSLMTSAPTRISTGSGKSTRRNTMPVSGCAGRSTSSTRAPPCRPTPTARVTVFRVRCANMRAMVRLGQSACLRRKAGISKSSTPADDRASTLEAAVVRLLRHTLGTVMLP